MNTINKIFFCFILLSLQLNYGQNPLNVVVTEECEDLTAIYEFTNVVNGKNHYTHEFYDEEEEEYVNVNIGFDGSKWVVYAFDMSFYGFYNTQVPNSMLPPFTGWIPNECNVGNLTINEVLSTNEFSISHNLVIFPNPVVDFLYVSDKDFLSYSITNLKGQTLLKGTNSERIDLSSLKSGIYLINLKLNNSIERRKFIKK